VQVEDRAAGEPGGSYADLLALAKQVDQELEREAAPGSAEAQAQASAIAAAPKLSLEQEFAGLVAMIGAGLGKWLPSVKNVLNEQACAEVGQVLAPVAHKYGLARYVENFAWRVELQALIVVVPIGFAVADAVRQDLAALKQKREAQGAGAPAGALGEGSPAPAAQAAGSSAAPAGQPGMLQPVQR